MWENMIDHIKRGSMPSGWTMEISVVRESLRNINVRCFIPSYCLLVAQMVKRLPAMWETWVRSLGWEDLLEKEMTIHSNILAWRIPWIEGPGRLQSQRVRHDWATSLSLGEGNGNPLQYSCLENSMDEGAWWAVVHGVTKSRTWLRDFTSLHCLMWGEENVLPVPSHSKVRVSPNSLLELKVFNIDPGISFLSRALSEAKPTGITHPWNWEKKSRKWAGCSLWGETKIALRLLKSWACQSWYW